MFKSGTRLSNSRLGTTTFSGTGGSMYDSGSIELTAGQLKYLYSGSISYRLDAYGAFQRGALVWSSHNDGRAQNSTQGTTFYCSYVYGQAGVCGQDSYGNNNYCNYYAMGPMYPDARVVLPQYSWTGSASEEIIDFSVGGYGSAPYFLDELTCNYSNIPNEWYCAITRFNKLFTWGYNGNGQLGSNSTINRSSPVQVGTLTDWLRIDSSELHNISLKTDGTLWAWGYGVYGQLGDGANSSRSSPVKIGNDTNWIDFSAGPLHSAGIKSDGTLWCWGQNFAGEIGDNSVTSRNSPVQVSGGGSWKKVVCGNSRTYGIKYDDTLWAWGYNPNGELGDNSVTSRSSPVQVSGGGYWRDVFNAYQKVLGIKTDGTLYTWGDNWGTTTSGYRSSPVQIGNKSYYRKLPTIKLTDGGFYMGVPTPNNVGFWYTGLSTPDTTVVPITIDTGDAIGVAATGALFDFYTGGGVRKIINSERNAWILKEYSQVSSGSSDLYSISGVTTGSLVAYTGTPRSVLFTAPGTHSIVVPPGMNYMHAVCIGGGGGGASGDNFGNDGGAGGGGALAYVNNISVTPGNLVTVAVGAGGVPGGFGRFNQNGQNGNPSEISYGGTLRARANGGNGGSGTIGGQGGTVGAGTGYSGGQGGYGTTTITPGGGGAGGYSGIGGRGAGNLGAGLSGGGGAGGGGGYASGGGGVGPYLEGPSGTGYTTVNNGGDGGSFGEKGIRSRGRGGLYGGGGSGGNWDNDNSFGTAGFGANGAVRLVFVASIKSGIRTFPTGSDFT